MYLQSVLFEKNKESTQDMFFRSAGDVQCNASNVTMAPGSTLSTYTYMNLFDAGNRRVITGADAFELEFEYSGEAELVLLRCLKGQEEEVCKKILKSESKKLFSFKFLIGEDDEVYYFDIRAITEFKFENVFYKSSTSIKDENKTTSEKNVTDIQNNIRIALLITTFNGTKDLARNLNVLKKSAFFSREVPGYLHHLYGCLDIYIVDNKSRLPLKDEKHLKIFHNKNTGGTGGFTRGITELRKRAGSSGITHVIFMDDDVVLEAECLYRLFALLAGLKPEESLRPVAGRMFDLSEPGMQYTASEQWNKGYVRHLGHDLDMKKEECLEGLNGSSREGSDHIYGGWWFCCYPYSFVEKNTPLPFFLHCDDVEYGIRCAQTPIILNGIDVKHDTPENKASSVLAYYDARNTMIVNAVYGLATSEEMLEQWRNRLASFRDKNDHDGINMTILGMLHFLKGPEWFMNVDGEQLHKRLKRKNIHELKLIAKTVQISYKFVWRSIDAIARIRIGPVVKKYAQLRDRTGKE